MPSRLSAIYCLGLFVSCFTSNLPVYSGDTYGAHYNRIDGSDFLIASQSINSQMQEGVALFTRGSYSDAISIFSRIISSELSTRAQKNNALLARAQAFIVMGQPALAVSDLNNSNFSVGDREKLSNKHLIKGVAFIQLKNYNAAVIELSKSINIVPTESSAYANRAVAYQSLGNLDLATNDFNRALEINPIPSTIYNLAVLEKLKDNYSNCYLLLEKLVDAKAIYSDVYFQKGLCAQLLGDEDQALEDFLKAASIDNSNPVILENIGLIVLKRGDSKTGIGYLEKASEIYLSQGKIDEYTKVVDSIASVRK